MAISHGSISGGLEGAGEVDVLLGGTAVGGARRSSKFHDGTFPDADGGRVTGVDTANGKALTLGAGLGRNIEFVPANDVAFTLGAGLGRNGAPEIGPAEVTLACPQLSKLKASLSLRCFSARSSSIFRCRSTRLSPWCPASGDPLVDADINRPEKASCFGAADDGRASGVVVRDGGSPKDAAGAVAGGEML